MPVYWYKLSTKILKLIKLDLLYNKKCSRGFHGTIIVPSWYGEALQASTVCANVQIRNTSLKVFITEFPKLSSLGTNGEVERGWQVWASSSICTSGRHMCKWNMRTHAYLLLVQVRCVCMHTRHIHSPIPKGSMRSSGLRPGELGTTSV